MSEQATTLESLDDPARRAERDRLLYHNPDGIYRSNIGIYDEASGKTFCCGCWWCEGPPTEAHGWGL